MVCSSYWSLTKLPPSLMDEIINELDSRLGDTFEVATTFANSDFNQEVNIGARDSSTSWLNWEHWVGSMIWGQMKIINERHFGYDIDHIDNGQLQYTRYGPNQYYKWHEDEALSRTGDNGINFIEGDFEEIKNRYIVNKTKPVRKLSASLILNDDFDGGQFQIIEPNSRPYTAPSERGTLIVFDSRMLHRVRPVSNGVRKSIVAWGCGPRWK